MLRWKLELASDPNTSYVLEINPNQMTTPVQPQSIQWDYHPVNGYTGNKKRLGAHTWEFSGVLRSQAQYDALVLWANRKKTVKVTDDRGDTFLVKLLQFSPTQAGGGRLRHAPWRMEYSMSCLLYPGGTV